MECLGVVTVTVYRVQPNLYVPVYKCGSMWNAQVYWQSRHIKSHLCFYVPVSKCQRHGVFWWFASRLSRQFKRQENGMWPEYHNKAKAVICMWCWLWNSFNGVKGAWVQCSKNYKDSSPLMHMCLIWHAGYKRFALVPLSFLYVFYAWVEIRYTIVIIKGITRNGRGCRVVNLAL